MQRDALAIFQAALKAADPAQAVMNHLRVEGGNLVAGRKRYPIDRRIIVVGAGKAAAAMGAAVEKLLVGRINDGFLNVKYGHTGQLRHIKQNECGHPIPDEAGVAGAQEIANLVAGACADDLIICLLSGGASALLPFPAQPLTLEMKQETTKLLLRSGATIHEINAVRKHISSIKGGWLAALAYPAQVLTLVLSDVIGNNLDVIGSGVTAPDSSTYADAQAVLRKYGIWDEVPTPVRQRLEDGLLGHVPETPKANHACFQRTQNLIIGSNDLALEAAAEHARSLRYKTVVLSSFIEGETREVAKVHAAIAKEILASGQPAKRPACIISGGETTVTVRGDGKGGRNQEFALAAAMEIAGLDRVFMLSAGTDGTDGPTDAAGAWCDGGTLQRGPDAAAYLANNDSYNYFAKTGGLIKTGPTGTNVMDVRLVLVR